MSSISRFAVSVLLAAGSATAALTIAATPVLAADPKPAAAKPPKLTKAVAAALAEAQKLQQAGDNAGGLVKVNEALAVPSPTAEDGYWINAIKRNIAIGLKDHKLLAEALKGQLDSGLVPAAELPTIYRNLGALALETNDYNTATGYFEKLTALQPTDGDAMVGLAELYQRQKQTGKAVATLGRAADAYKAAGQPVPETIYRRRLAIAYDAKLADQIQPLSVALVSAYPTPVNWRDALTIFRDGSKLDEAASLDTLRLMQTVGALNGERDYFEYAEVAANKGLPAEAKMVLDDGVAKGMLSPAKPFVKELAGVVTPKLAADKAGLAGAERDAGKAATGKLALVTGDAYYGYSNYAKAAELYRMALSKGGVDADTANTRLGIALAKSGDKAGAKTAFDAVKGPGARSTIADYWRVWLAQKA